MRSFCYGRNSVRGKTAHFIRVITTHVQHDYIHKIPDVLRDNLQRDLTNRAVRQP